MTAGSPVRTQSTPVASEAASIRVLFVIPGQPIGNSMIFAARQAQSLASQGVAVDCFYLATRTSLHGLLEETRRFRTVVALQRPQVIHAHFGTVTALFTALAATFLKPGWPLVITYRGGDLNPLPRSAPCLEKLRSLVGSVLSQIAALRAARIICVSHQLRDRLWWRKNRTVVLPSGVNPQTFFPQPQHSARNQLNWKAEERIVLFNSGGPALVKRPDLARAAVEYAARRVPGLRMAVADGTIPPDLMPVWMNASDCLLLTSETEGSPTVIQEALACGLPIVTVDVGDTRDRLRGMSQVRLTARTTEALGEAIIELLLSGSGERAARSPDACPTIEEFSAQRIARELQKIYCDLIPECRST